MADVVGLTIERFREAGVRLEPGLSELEIVVFDVLNNGFWAAS